MDETKYKRVCKEACVKATTILKSGGSTLDACEAAIVCLENSGNTNAGKEKLSITLDHVPLTVLQRKFKMFFYLDFSGRLRFKFDMG